MLKKIGSHDYAKYSESGEVYYDYCSIRKIDRLLLSFGMKRQALVRFCGKSPFHHNADSLFARVLISSYWRVTRRLSRARLLGCLSATFAAVYEKSEI